MCVFARSLIRLLTDPLYTVVFARFRRVFFGISTRASIEWGGGRGLIAWAVLVFVFLYSSEGKFDVWSVSKGFVVVREAYSARFYDWFCYLYNLKNRYLNFISREL